MIYQYLPGMRKAWECNDVNCLSHLKYDINIDLETWKGTEPNVCILPVVLPMQSVPVITDIMSSNLDQGEVYNIM